MEWLSVLIFHPGIYKFINYLKCTLDKLDIVINNAAQTIHRPVEFYRHLLDYEQLSTHALPESQQRLLVGGANLNMGITSQNKAESQSDDKDNVTEENCSIDIDSNTDNVVEDKEVTEKQHCDRVVELPEECSTSKIDQNNETTHKSVLNLAPSSHSSTDLANLAPPTQMRAPPPMRMSSFEREALFPAGRFDTDGQQLDLRRTNTWRTILDEVPVGELLEVNYIWMLMWQIKVGPPPPKKSVCFVFTCNIAKK